MCKVMIIDGNPTMQNWLFKCIEKSNITKYEIILCNSINEALEDRSHSNVDIVLIKLKEDDFSNGEVIKKLKNKLIFTIILGYGPVTDFNDLCTIVNNGMSKYIKDVFDQTKLVRLIKEAYEEHCTDKLYLSQNVGDVQSTPIISYSTNVLNDWVDGFTRNALDGNRKNIETYIGILKSLMDRQKLYHSKSMILELLVIIYDKAKKGEFKTDYRMLKTNECYKLMNVNTSENLKNVVEDYMAQIAENIHLMSTVDNSKSSIIIPAIKYINRNYNKDISRDDVAKAVSLNPSYFSKLFKEQMGESFVSYLRRIRIEQAINYLEKTNYSIKDISKNVGYKDNNYFSRLFYKHTGYKLCSYRNDTVKLIVNMN